MNCGSGSLWVRLSPPRPAIRNLRPADGIPSWIVTAAPPCASTSAAIRPAGPAPMTATLFWESGVTTGKVHALLAAGETPHPEKRAFFLARVSKDGRESLRYRILRDACFASSSG